MEVSIDTDTVIITDIIVIKVINTVINQTFKYNLIIV